MASVVSLTRVRSLIYNNAKGAYNKNPALFINMRKLLLFIIITLTLAGQTTINVGGASSGWTVATVSPDPQTTVYMSDVISDQQTGQGSDDFVGTTTTPGMFLDFGTVNGAQSLGFRFYMNKYETNGFSGNLRVGVDANRDGGVDIFFGPKLGGSAASQGIVFQNPGAGLNVSPSTTSLGTNYGRIAFTADNYNYQLLTPTIDPNWVNIGSNSNSVLSFDLPFTSLQSSLAAAGINIDADTMLAFIAFTSTQSNAINQDLYGSSGITNTARFDGPSGGFTDYYSANGAWTARPIVPEAQTYGAVLLGFSLLFVGYRRYKQRS